MQLVKNVIQELTRFNPEAYLEQEVEIQSVAPSVRCSIRTAYNSTIEGEIESLKDEIKSLEDELEDTPSKEDYESMVEDLKDIKAYLKDGNVKSALVIAEQY